MKEETARHVARVGFLLLVAVGLLAGLWLLRGSSEGASVFPAGDDRAVQIRVGDRRWLVRDADGDGRVDCLLSPGAIGRSGYRPEGSSAHCRVVLGTPRPMPEDLRPTLDQFLSKKGFFRAGHTTPADLDGDGLVDCVHSLFQPDRVVLHADGAPCAGPGSRLLTEKERTWFSELLPVETEARRKIEELASW